MRSLSGLKCLPRIILLVAATVLPSAAQQTQQTDDLQKQLDQLKQQYEQTTSELQQRIVYILFYGLSGSKPNSMRYTKA
jgi:hypothetical protein